MRYEEEHQLTVPDDNYVYMPGVGFVTPNPSNIERASIRRASIVLGACFCLFYTFRTWIPQMLLRLYVRVTGSGAFLYRNDLFLESFHIISHILIYCLPFIFYLRYVKMPKRVAIPLKKSNNFGISAGAVSILLCIGMLGNTAGGMLTKVLGAWGFQTGGQELQIPSNPWGIALQIIDQVVILVFLEELLYRGLIMQSLRRYGDSFALIISTLLFTGAYQNVFQFPAAFLIGLTCGYFVLKTGSLYTSIAMRFFERLAVYVLTVVSTYARPEYYTFVQRCFFVVIIIAALISVSLMTNRNHNMFAVNSQATNLRYRVKYKLFFTTFPMVAAVFVVLLGTWIGLKV